MFTKRNLSILTLGLVVSAFVSQSALAMDKEFKKKHPRRAEVLGRANNEERKNNTAAADGEITKKQAAKLDRQDQRIKRQEQREARVNGGYITKGEQAQLNKEENHVNQERNKMEAKDAAANGGTPAAQ